MSQKHREVGLTIGAVSRATGIPSNTLRTWERRYGFPTPDRTDGGQRLYRPEVVERLRLVTEALDKGHRAKQVVAAPLETLWRLVGAPERSLVPETSSAPGSVDFWVDAARRLDADALTASFRSEFAVLGGMGFLTQRVAPFLEKIGEEWSEGNIAVYQEHFASERLRAFLVGVWQPLSETAEGPPLVLACLPGEEHDLGLHMAGVVTTLAGWQVIYLGRNTPVDQIEAAAKQGEAVSVLVSVSQFGDLDRAREGLTSLRAKLPGRLELIAGGAGAPDGVDNVQVLEDLVALHNWANAKRKTL